MVDARLGAAFATLLTACAGPTLTVHSDADAEIAVDGRVRGRGEAHGPLPYYGAMAITAMPPIPTSPAETPRRPARADVTVDEPVTPWLFPFDFVVELAGAPWAVTEHETTIVPPPRERLAEGAPAPDAAQILERARAARIAR